MSHFLAQTVGKHIKPLKSSSSSESHGCLPPDRRCSSFSSDYPFFRGSPRMDLMLFHRRETKTNHLIMMQKGIRAIPPAGQANPLLRRPPGEVSYPRVSPKKFSRLDVALVVCQKVPCFASSLISEIGLASRLFWLYKTGRGRQLLLCSSRSFSLL